MVTSVISLSKESINNDEFTTFQEESDGARALLARKEQECAGRALAVANSVISCVMSATPTLHAFAGLITLRRCQFPPSAQTVTRRVSAGTKRWSLAHSASRHFSSSLCLRAGPHKASKHDNYDKAEWIEKLQARKEHQNRELTDKEKEAFLEQRKKRLEQLQIKKELKKSFRQDDMKTVWALHERLSHRDEWTYNQMIAVAAKGGHVQKAFSIYQKMKKVPLTPSLSTYHWLLQACANGQGEGEYLARAFYTMEQMEAQKIKMTLHTYNLVLQICANAKDIEAAAEVLRKMAREGIQADVSSLSSLLNCTRGPNIEPINQVWKELQSKFTPDSRAWNTYINVLRDSGFYKEALEAFHQMIASPPAAIEIEEHPELYGAYALSSSQPKNSADPKKPLTPTIIPSAFSLSLILDCCAQAKLFVEARAILTQIFELWKDKITYDEVLFQSMLRIASRFKPNVVFATVKLLEAKKIPVSITTRELIIMAFGRAGDLKETLKHFDVAHSSGQLNLRCFTGVLIACRSAQDPDRAWLSFQVLIQTGIWVDDVYLRLLREIFTNGGRTDLLRKLDEVLPTVKRASDRKASKEYQEKVAASTKAQEQVEDSSEELDAEEEEVSPQEERVHRRRSDSRAPSRPQHGSRSNIQEEDDDESTNLVRMRNFQHTAILPTATTPSSASPLAKAARNVILPQSTPSAERSPFFASERIAKRSQSGKDTL